MTTRAPGTAGATLTGLRLHRTVTARTPASSANLGPGFDSLGLALALHDEVSVTAAEPGSVGHAEDIYRPGAAVEVEGEGAGAVPLGEDHLVVRSLRAGLAHAGVAQPALQLQCRNAIPHGRGLGSSAAAIAVGLVLARGLLTEPERLADEALYALAAAAEGHPDNASAALYGGFTISWTEPELLRPHLHRVGVVRLDVDPRLRVVVCVPGQELATSRARAMLPATVPHADAAFTAGRAALLVHALTAAPELLLAATQERLHQQQRAPAMPATAALVAAVRERGGAAVVSGAGPSVLVLGPGDAPADAVGAALSADGERLGQWQVHALAVAATGTVLT